MDLSDFDITVAGDEAQPLTLLDPRNGQAILGDDGEPVIFYVVSTDSDVFTKYRYEQRAKAARNRLSNDAQAMADREVEWAAKLLMGKAWSANFAWKGHPLAWNLMNARSVMRIPQFRVQVEEFAGNAANFLPNLPSNSPSTESISSGSASAPATAA